MSIRFVYNYLTKKMSSDPTLVPPGTLPTTFIPTTSAGNVGYMVMSYPGRPQMVPGIPMPPGMGMPYMQLGAPPPLMPGVPMQMGHMMGAPPMAAPMVPRPYRPSPVTTSAPPRPKTVPPVRYLPPQPDGPAVTLFIGNIAEKAPDQMVRFILSACGHVTSWKRVQGFGFCEFGNPDAGLRAIRLLHNYEIGGKKLVVRVDARAKTVLEDYKNEKRKKTASSSPLQDEHVDEHDYMDEDMKNSDKAALDRISMILNDYDNEMKSYIPPLAEETKPVPEVKPVPTPQMKHHHDGPSSVDLTDTNFDDDHRRELITREIGKFREFMKKQEEEKEVERKKREEKERERRSDRSPGGGRGGSRARSPAHDRSSSPAESVSRHRSHKSNRHRTKSRSREREREKERDNRERERDNRERERDSERTRDREREKERDSKSERDLLREKEEEEEAKEKKKLDRKAREKEAAYQERLRTWESRERHKVKESLKDKEKRRLKEEEREKEAKRLKEFLEDYDDERDDIKYYKGRELARRLEEREKEMETDAKDRQKEKEELAELKAKIFAGNSDDPNAEFAKAIKAREELYKPKILVNMEEKKAPAEGKEKERGGGIKERIIGVGGGGGGGGGGGVGVGVGVNLGTVTHRDMGMVVEEEEEVERKRRPVPVAASPSDSSRGASPAPPSPQSSPDQRSPEPPQEIIKSVSNKGYLSPSDRKKKKLDLKEVFNNDEDEESTMMNKKRKLVPLDYTEDKKKPNAKDMINPGIVKEVLHGKPDRETNQQHLPVQPPPVVPSKEEKKEEQAKSQEEKRKHIKSLIDRIPTDKAALFSYTLDWAAVDNQLMERRIRPWINKKIIEYIGEPEPTLVDFICSKVLAGSAPQGILDDVQMVLDEEAEVFVVKMWRLLIYEIEAKKLGLVK